MICNSFLRKPLLTETEEMKREGEKREDIQLWLVSSPAVIDSAQRQLLACIKMNKIMRRIVFSIEGNIGSGKTTLVRALQRTHPKYIVADEPIQLWQQIKSHNLLDQYYADPQRWAYTFQNYVIFTRIKSLQHLLTAPASPDSYMFSERSVEADKNIFAKLLLKRGFMNDMEHALYLSLFDGFSQLYQPTPIFKHVYLRTDPKECLERIRRRERREESQVTLEYLQSIHQLHQEWLGGGFTIEGTPEFEKDGTRLQQIIGQIDSWVSAQSRSADWE